MAAKWRHGGVMVALWWRHGGVGIWMMTYNWPKAMKQIKLISVNIIESLTKLQTYHCATPSPKKL